MESLDQRLYNCQEMDLIAEYSRITGAELDRAALVWVEKHAKKYHDEWVAHPEHHMNFFDYYKNTHLIGQGNGC